jgi:hypothetical protein
MVENSIDRKKIHDELKFERAKLYEDTRLALTIKIIDDEIADCTQRMRTKEKSTEIAEEEETLLHFKKTPPRTDGIYCRDESLSEEVAMSVFATKVMVFSLLA